MAARWSNEQFVVELKDLQQANAMAVDCLGQWVLLGGKRALTLIGLDNPAENVKKITRHSKWDISCVQWNPHACHAHWFAVACSQRVDLYSWAESHGDRKSSMRAHSRVVSDLDWSPFDVNVLASCSVDSYTYLWDVRDPKKPVGSFQTVAGASQVQWNKVTNNMFATTHEGDVRVWDSRKGNKPIHYIAAHLSKIYGLDWSPFSEFRLATSSQDCTVKFWDINCLKRHEELLTSGSPVWKARYTPFGHGLVTVVVPQLRRETFLYLWNISTLKQPVHTFVGHTDVVLDFHWRKQSEGCKDYQLVTWSKDQSLRIWKIDPQLQQLCGHDVLDSVDEPVLMDEALTRDESKPKENKTVEPLTGREEPVFVSLFKPQTLLQEFSLVNRDIPKVDVEMMDAESRTCTVRATSGRQEVRLFITFPDNYPNNAAPTFEFSKGTTVEELAKAKLQQVLIDTSLQHVKRNRSCLEPCLRQLITNLDKLTAEERKSPDTEVSFNVPPKQQPAILSSCYYYGFQDSSVPFPRTSGARFCSAGYLVCFGRPTVTKKPVAEKTPKSLSALAYVQSSAGMRSPQSSAPYSALFSRSPPASSGVYSISNFYYRDRKRNRSRSRTKDSSETKMKDLDSKKQPKVSPVKIYNVSSLLIVNKHLAEGYIIDIGNIPRMCSINSNLAAVCGRKDLVQVWSLVSLVASKHLSPNENPDDGAPWACHPFGRKLMKSLIDHYSRIYDVQTLAMLSCIFWTKEDAERVQHRPPSPRPIREYIPPNYSPYHTVSSATNLSKGGGPNGWQPLTQSVAPPMLLNKICSHPNITTPALLHPAINLRRSNSWSDSYEGYKFENSKNVKETDSEQHLKNCSLLDPACARQYEQFKKSYSEILYKWKYFNKHAEIVKHMVLDTEPNSGLELLVRCHYCKSCTKASHCDQCHNIALHCAVCQIGVKGVANFCLACGHGGHMMHMLEWFRFFKQCPSGCGCLCLDQNPMGFM